MATRKLGTTQKCIKAASPSPQHHISFSDGEYQSGIQQRCRYPEWHENSFPSVRTILCGDSLSPWLCLWRWRAQDHWWVTDFFNSSPPSARYMRRWTGSALVQVMDCRRKGITWTNVNYTLRKSFIANLIVCESMAILNYGRWDNALPKWALFEDEISKCPFIKRERLGLDQNFTDVCSWGFKWQCLHICSHSWTGDKPESGWLSNLLRHISVTRHQCVIKVDATCVRNFQFRCWKLNAGYIYILLIYI